MAALRAMGVAQNAQNPATQPQLPQPVPSEDRLSLLQAVQLGLQKNPQMAAAQWSVESARQNYNSQKAPINPTVGYAALNSTVAPVSWANGFGSGYNYSVYATIETNGAIKYRTAQAREAWHQAQFDAATTGLSLKLNIINAYIGVQVANRALEVEMKVYDNMRELAELTQKRFETGAGPQADVTRAKIAEIQEAQNVIADVQNVDAARATLNNQLGRPQNAPVDAAEPLVYRHVGIGELSTLTRQAEEDRPELKSAQANLRSLKAVPGLENSQYYPNLVFGRDFGGDDTLYVGFSIPIDLGGIRGEVARAKADVKTQQAQVDQQRQGIELDVKSAYVNFAAAQQQVDTYDAGVLQMSETLLDQVRHGYELGANTIVDILTAENTYRAVESSYYAAVGTYVSAAYTLKHSIGELPDNLPVAALAGIGRVHGSPVIEAAVKDKQ